MTFGTLLRQEREARELTFRDMAKRIGVTPGYVSLLERGWLPPPAEQGLIR